MAEIYHLALKLIIRIFICIGRYIIFIIIKIFKNQKKKREKSSTHKVERKIKRKTQIKSYIFFFFEKKNHIDLIFNKYMKYKENKYLYSFKYEIKKKKFKFLYLYIIIIIIVFFIKKYKNFIIIYIL